MSAGKIETLVETPAGKRGFDWLVGVWMMHRDGMEGGSGVDGGISSDFGFRVDWFAWELGFPPSSSIASSPSFSPSMCGSSLPGGNPPDVDSPIVCHAHRHHHAMWEVRSELHSEAKR